VRQGREGGVRRSRRTRSRVPGCYINLGNDDVEGGCEVYNPGYDFNDEALPLGASFFARVVETRPARTPD